MKKGGEDVGVIYIVVADFQETQFIKDFEYVTTISRKKAIEYATKYLKGESTLPIKEQPINLQLRGVYSFNIYSLKISQYDIAIKNGRLSLLEKGDD